MLIVIIQYTKGYLENLDSYLFINFITNSIFKKIRIIFYINLIFLKTKKSPIVKVKRELKSKKKSINILIFF
jgi:hypothetical protein